MGVTLFFTSVDNGESAPGLEGKEAGLWNEPVLNKKQSCLHKLQPRSCHKQIYPSMSNERSGTRSRVSQCSSSTTDKADLPLAVMDETQ